MKTYLVTGIAGFIGSALGRALLERGDRVIGIDNLSTGIISNIPDGVEFYKDDCQNPLLYKKILPRLSYAAIFHIAGQSSGEISFDDPVHDLRCNTEATLHLLRFALDTGCQRFCYASSMSVYGKQPDKPVSESAHTEPLSFYGVGKLASEHYMKLFENYGIQSTALRLFNVYGPGQNMWNMRQGMVSIFMAMMLRNSLIHVKGSSERYRDFVYIDDVINAFLLCLERNDPQFLVINIGGGRRVTVAQLIAELIQLSPEPVAVKYEGHTAGDIHGIYADLSNAKNILGYSAKISLQKGLKKMHDWAINAR